MKTMVPPHYRIFKLEINLKSADKFKTGVILKENPGFSFAYIVISQPCVQ